jgi:hypothetical protein
MRQIAILALIVLAVSAMTPPMKINCTHLNMMPLAYNFYNPPMECAKNDTAIMTCMTLYDTCTKAATTCATGLGGCTAAKLRCFETAAPTSQACTLWLTMFSNEKLYITAGGDYNGSSLELSCRKAVCDFEANKTSLNCSSEEQNVCKDMLAVSVPSTIPPAGKTVVSFTINGDKAKFTAWLAKDKVKAFGILARILAKILKTDFSNIVIIDVKVGSLTVDFYTTDDTLDVATVTARMGEAKNNTDQAQYFTELATDAGIDVSTMNIGAITVSQATDAPPPGTTPLPATPVPGAGTPAPLAPTSASAVATAIAVVATVAAMLF